MKRLFSLYIPVNIAVASTCWKKMERTRLHRLRLPLVFNFNRFKKHLIISATTYVSVLVMIFLLFVRVRLCIIRKWN